MDETRTWAWEEFGGADLGDARRVSRLVEMAALVAARPNGVVAKVFKVPAQRQGAYDWLNNSRVSADAVMRATAEAAAKRCTSARTVRLVIDGTSASLSDPSKTKELGPIGKRSLPTRGVKFVDVCAVDDRGVPAGLVALCAWTRGPKRTATRSVRRRLGLSEMARYWVPTLRRAAELVREQVDAQLWIVGDRECDDARFLRAAAALGTFTVRAAQNRLVSTSGGRSRKLFAVARKGRLIGLRRVQLPATNKSPARTAVIEVRLAKTTVQLPMYDGTKKRVPLEVHVVELRERGNRRGRLSWTLLTNASVQSAEQVDEVVASYRARWRIEDFHRAWKAGACNLEATQLGSREAITKWATLLGSVAARAERLKHLARTAPETPASNELTDVELVALKHLKRRIRTSVEHIPDGIPTIALATRWIAELGGWAGHYKKYQPGTTTIARGLEYLATWSDAVADLLDPKEIKRRLR